MKTYIKPAVEVHKVTSRSNILSTSFKVNDTETTEQLVRQNGWDDLWGNTEE